MANKTASVADFWLNSTWTNSGGAITSGPSTASEIKVFKISGIPAGVTIDSAKLSVTLGSPYTGAAILTVNGENASAGTKTYDVTPTEGGNGDYSVPFVFKAAGATGLSDGQHSAAVKVSGAVLTVTYTADAPSPDPDPEPVITWDGDRPMCVFALDNIDRYNNNGMAVLTPTKGKGKAVAGGTCEINFTHPIDPEGKWAYLVPGAIVRAPVPEETIENAFVGIDVDLYRTNASAPLRAAPTDPSTITYPEWDWTTAYTVGSKVTETGHGNYQCVAYDGTTQQIIVPPHSNSDWWRQIPSSGGGAAVLVQLASGQDLYFLEDAGSGWYKMTTPLGIEGYIKSSQVTFIQHLTPQATDEQVIRDQLFRIKSVTVDTKAMEVNVYAQHVAYDLSAILVRDVDLSKAAPSMAITRIMDSLMMAYRGNVATNLTSTDDGTYTGKINGKNGTFALLDPDSGVVSTFKARLARNNWDIYILKDTPRDRGMRMAYGKNVRGITWKRGIESLATRVVPVAKNEKGEDLYLPENYVDSPNINDQPVIYMQRLAVKGQVGKDDGTGTGTVWTAETLYAEMRSKAQELFDVDHADDVYTEISVDFEQRGDTAEYAWMKALEKINLYDTVHAADERVGLEQALKVTELEWDLVRKKITALKMSTTTDHGMTTVAGYNVANNSIGTEKLTEAAITEIANLLS